MEPLISSDHTSVIEISTGAKDFYSILFVPIFFLSPKYVCVPVCMLIYFSPVRSLGPYGL